MDVSLRQPSKPDCYSDGDSLLERAVSGTLLWVGLLLVGQIARSQGLHFCMFIWLITVYTEYNT